MMIYKFIVMDVIGSKYRANIVTGELELVFLREKKTSFYTYPIPQYMYKINFDYSFNENLLKMCDKHDKNN